ncbi:hypothetical protein [Ligilactobacillus murinus]|uniref:Uncharacterized protein n=1 Tax=Ligilactobacillus murinus TaxID=1622 RepID=A0AAE6WGQ0_9LACO|nr:hypothetical protein [Ligilactobacillus murinus]NEF81960.1 hypothetical protein [Ligilactobacillus murinus]NEF84284.1 hypothetical protein [Ligilactobacillus murinus]NEF86516.1 hypothetical protein [Ligilactobacillus murinus]NEF88901.1 hypothetical protein [Ligilactobacillus murinus]NEF91169.1 hypothetical protein [Ligilactobacillus murinus]
MRFNKRAFFRKNDLEAETLPVNLTSMGAQQQQLVFGNVKQERVIARFLRPVSVRTGYFIVDDKIYQITMNITSERRTTLYGVEYHGRL